MVKRLRAAAVALVELFSQHCVATLPRRIIGGRYRQLRPDLIRSIKLCHEVHALSDHTSRKFIPALTRAADLAKCIVVVPQVTMSPSSGNATGFPPAGVFIKTFVIRGHTGLYSGILRCCRLGGYRQSVCWPNG